ncbi:RNA polymerase sigma factor [Bacteroidota bacterium]
MALHISWNKYQHLSDAELIEEFRNSEDLEQLGTLYERYMHLVYGVCLKYFKDREEARDAVSSIFEKLITEIPNHTIENFKSWLYVLTKNFCLMKLRSEKSEARRKDSWMQDQNVFMESSEEMHPIDEDEVALNKALIECIKRLKEEQERCIRLFYFDNKSYKEIASALGIQEKKVKSLIQNGKRNLKICLENTNDQNT